MNWFFGLGSKKRESKKSYYTPLSKYYAFNETGNVMVCTTGEGAEAVNESLLQMFSDMSIFFAAMTKAIVTHDEENGKAGSIYNSNAILNILNESELFVEVRGETISAESSSVGDSMSKELTENLLGREFGESRLNFSRGLLRSMSDRSRAAGDAGSIFFVCESILGLPMVSAVVVTLDSSRGAGRQNGKSIEAREMSEILDIAEKDGTNSIIREWKFKKKTYLFISPRSISGANFPDPGDDLEYESLVDSLKSHLAKGADSEPV